ncbi:efflux RND transporter permease subunit [Kyrpidia tusciae]|uniref:Acriflavin resistance protein n=1 Tax=Kyrpidia tusciae (strain DSM 2912 / NBRC 15312 / T2) TaxID=562970 RepID=D5WWL0_KYRT2|nr:efflux RND transporter permease subunit [Kyrpidia tusciae]ADG07775.1 acriflavin resistance protein [Kyrpidia tusciae DSM 2912]
MKIADFSVERPVTISMIMVVLILLGSIALPLLRVDLYPTLSIPVAVVTTTWNGASPEEMEQQVSKPIEAAMATVQGVSEVDSSSRQGGSLVVVHFNYGVNLDQAMLNMRDKLDRVRKALPDGADTPQVMRLDPNSMPILSIAMSGPMDPVELQRLASDVVEPRLSRVNGVASATVSGGRQRQIQVVLGPAKMQAYGISINQVLQAIQGDNTSADAGVVDQGTRRVTVRVIGDFQSVQDLGDVPIHLSGSPSGAAGPGSAGDVPGVPVLHLRDIADIQDTFAEVTQSARLNGQQSVSIDVYKVSDGNTVQVSDNVRKELDTLQKLLPPTVKLSVISDQATFIKQSIDTVVNHTLLGALFSVVVLYLFLRRVRTTLVIAVVIPISVISTFSLLYFSGQTINVITLGGLALGLGSLVDFAVVVLESIFRHRSEGAGPKEAAKVGTAEVGTAVMASALSQIAVFLPIAFTQGLAQQLFGPLALTVSFSHIAALFGALTLVPMLAARWIPEMNEEEELRRAARWNPVAAFGRGIQTLNRGYGHLLRWALGHRKTVIAATLALFVASVAMVPLIGFELTPTVDNGQFRVSIETGTGTNLQTTDRVATQVETVLHRIPEVDRVFTQLGGGGQMGFGAAASTDRANLQVELKPLAERHRSTEQVMEQLRQEVSRIPGARITVSAGAGPQIGAGGAPIQVQISGPDVAVLQQLSDEVQKALSAVPGLRNIQSSLDRQVPQFQILVDRQRAAQYGLSVGSIVSAVRTASAGSVATQYRAADASIDVLVKYPDSFTRQYSNLSQIMIAAPTGGQVALGDVAKIVPGVGPATITRVNQNRTVTVSAELFNVPLGNAQQAVRAKLQELPLPDGYTVQLGGQANDLNDSFRSLGLAMPLAIVFVYMVMASQFESLFSPFIIMFSLPPTFIGAALGLVVTHRALSIDALTGMIMVIGIVVNNAIVLVDYINQLRKRGLARNDAIEQAGPIRLRPILMTTATTVLAMLPLVIGYGEGAEAQAPMATVVAFGLTVSTLVTLVLVPVVYTLFDDFGHWIRRRLGRVFGRRSREAEA